SRGISEALVNTAAGLAIGIPAMVFYAFFRGRAHKLLSELEAASTHVLALLSLQYGKRAERTPVLIEDEIDHCQSAMELRRHTPLRHPGIQLAPLVDVLLLL